MMFEAILDSTLAVFSTVANGGIDILIRVTLLMIFVLLLDRILKWRGRVLLSSAVWDAAMVA